jgi:hypothetical protein
MPLLNWRAHELLSTLATAERAALIETLDAAVAAAKADHGWQSRTGAALSSIQREDVQFRSEEAGLRLALAGRGTGERGLVGAFGFIPIPLTGNTHRARSQKTGRLRKPRKWDVHGRFLEIGFRGRPADHTIGRAAAREFPRFPERIRQHLPADLRS